MSNVGNSLKDGMQSLIKKHLQKKAIMWFLGSSVGLIILIGLLVLVMVIGVIASLGGETEPSNDNIGSTINISPEVEKYRSAVQKEAAANGIPELTNLLLALIMQESGGRYLDIMQASESLGLPPNTISNPYESIRVGVANFAATYRLAEKAKMNVTETALQGYNFGSGFIGWSIKRDGGWTQKNAIEFSRIYSKGVKRPNGTWRYGDQYYVDHVMRYLQPGPGDNNNGQSPIKGGNKVIEAAIKAGSTYIGRSSYIMGGGRNQRDIAKGIFDCSSFVHYAFKQAGVSLGNLSSTTTDTIVVQGKKVSYAKAKRGDLVFFDTYKKNGHVGIYLGDGTFLNCQNSYGVSIASMSNTYWKSKFNGVVVRIVQ
ncbi:bifunctional lytic transglycosylase/C40 family peptidase [Bacillus sp. LLTC93]|nr:bifunctional lytic transglycosylase/C40 family peptidase [Bacillus sp. LLTC93]PRO39517.1 lytic transglycosylase [Bacillus sp. LLTC93]